jgi:hypothetical protein
MPKPKEGETEREFLKRCIPQLISEEGYLQKQSVAICYSIYRKEGTEEKSPKPQKKSNPGNPLSNKDKAKLLCYMCDL